MPDNQLETILLVENNLLQRATVAQYMRDCGHQVVEATSAAEARVALSRLDISIVVTDVNLRGSSGSSFRSWHASSARALRYF